MRLSTSGELDQLQSTKTQLENEYRSLEEEQKNLELRTRILEEKIAVEELKRNNKAKHEAVEQLRNRIGELEQRLNNIFGSEPSPPMKIEPEPETITEVAEPEYAEPQDETTSTVIEPPTEEQEDNVEVTALDDLVAPGQEEPEIQKKAEKKRRRLF